MEYNMENKCKDCHYWRDSVEDLKYLKECTGYCAIYGETNPERCGCPMWIPGVYSKTN